MISGCYPTQRREVADPGVTTIANLSWEREQKAVDDRLFHFVQDLKPALQSDTSLSRHTMSGLNGRFDWGAKQVKHLRETIGVFYYVCTSFGPAFREILR